VAVAAFWVVRYSTTVPSDQELAVASERPVHLRLQSFALSLHPLKMADVESRQVASMLYVGLIIQSQDGSILPAVAESWTQAGLTWEFAIRPGLIFSDGQPLRDQDIVTGLCNAMQPSSPWAWALASIRHEPAADGKSVSCSGVSVSVPGRVQIVQTQSVPWFLDALGGPAGWIIRSDADESAYGVMPGLGPYAIMEVVADTRIALQPRTSGSAIAPRLPLVQFDYLPDDAVAAEAFRSGRLQVLDLTSPRLVELLVDSSTGTLNVPGTLTRRDWDRVRIAVINEKSLAKKGFSTAAARRFIEAFSAQTDRARVANVSQGLGVPLYTGFPAVAPGAVPEPVSTEGLPKAALTIITESDPYSDLIAASLPRDIGKVTIAYRGVEKGVLIQSLVQGDFDIASILIEATTHSPEFWKSFFTPGNPFTAFGKPVAGLEYVDVSTEDGVRQGAELIGRDGNWVGILKETRLQAVAPGVTGVLFSPSGQTIFALIGRE
jgi:ABC-type transport system substrate-binding protein